MSYLCVDDFQYLLFICLYQWAFLIVIFLFLVVAFSFLLRDSLFRIWCKAGLHLTFNSLNFFLSVKFLISPLNGNESLAGSSINYCGFFYHFKYVIPLLYCRRYMKKSADNLVHIPFMLFVTFTLLFLIFFLCLYSSILFLCVSACSFLSFLSGILHFLDLDDCFLYHVRNVLTIIFWSTFSGPFSLWDPYNIHFGEVHIFLYDC